MMLVTCPARAVLGFGFFRGLMGSGAFGALLLDTMLFSCTRDDDVTARFFPSSNARNGKATICPSCPACLVLFFFPEALNCG